MNREQTIILACVLLVILFAVVFTFLYLSLKEEVRVFERGMDKLVNLKDQWDDSKVEER